MRTAANPSLNLEAIHPNYFSTFEVALVRGRVSRERTARTRRPWRSSARTWRTGPGLDEIPSAAD